MRLLAITAPTVLLFLMAAAVASAQTERYQLEKTEDGYVRMDTQTGEMAICQERAGQLVCKLAADERSAYENETDQLQAAIKALEERVAKLESAAGVTPKSTLPTEEEFEKTMGYMERFLRRFMGIAKDLEQEDKAPETKPSDPSRT
jgi:cell division protein FtsB